MVAARQKEKSTIDKNPGTISVRGSTGRKEKFDIDRMTQTTSSSGVSYLMARDTAKSTSNKLRKGVIEDTLKENTVTASDIDCIIICRQNPKKYTKRLDFAAQYESPIGSADSNQHESYRPIMDNLMHDQSKRYQSATSNYLFFEQS